MGDPDGKVLTFSSSSLTFTEDNWNTDQTVRLYGEKDANATHEAITVTLTAASAGYFKRHHRHARRHHPRPGCPDAADHRRR